MRKVECRVCIVELFMFEKNDEVWVGTDHGVAIISDGKVQKVLNESDGLTHHKILSIKESNGTVWIGTQSGLTAISEHDTVHISTNNELVDLRVKCLEIGVDGEIWMGTHSGIGKISKQSLKIKNSVFRGLMMKMG